VGGEILCSSGSESRHMSRSVKHRSPCPRASRSRSPAAHVTVKGAQGRPSARHRPVDIAVREGDGSLAGRASQRRAAEPCAARPASVRWSKATWSSAWPRAYRKELEIIGVGYRATAKATTHSSLALRVHHPVSVQAPAGITFEVPEPERRSRRRHRQDRRSGRRKHSGHP